MVISLLFVLHAIEANDTILIVVEKFLDNVRIKKKAPVIPKQKQVGFQIGNDKQNSDLPTKTHKHLTL